MDPHAASAQDPLDTEDDPYDSVFDEEDDFPDARFAARARGRLGRTAGRGFDQALDGLAERLEEAAEQLERLATEHLTGAGPRARAANVAQSTADRLADASEYLRASDIDGIRTDVERQVRDHPLRSILLAVGAGWVLGRIVR